MHLNDLQTCVPGFGCTEDAWDFSNIFMNIIFNCFDLEYEVNDMISLLANIGILFLAFYFYLRSKLGTIAYQENRKKSYLIKCILAEMFVGMIMLSFSIVIMNIRFDFRFLLFGFSAKYLDWKITSSSIVLLALVRFFYGGIEIAQIHLLASLVLAVVLPMIAIYTTDKLNDLPHLLTLVTVSTIPTFVATNQAIVDKIFVIELLLALLACGYGTTFIMYHFVTDLYSLIAFAQTDELTALKNVRTFKAKLLEMERSVQPITIAMIDLDHFKNYNDAYGHDSGDALLKQLGQVLNDFSGPGIDFYRIGGDEFAAIITHSEQHEAEAFLINLQKKISELDFLMVSGESLGVTVSIGLAHRQSGEKLPKLLNRADVALYAAKKDGRNKVTLYFPN